MGGHETLHCQQSVQRKQGGGPWGAAEALDNDEPKLLLLAAASSYTSRGFQVHKDFDHTKTEDFA